MKPISILLLETRENDGCFKDSVVKLFMNKPIFLKIDKKIDNALKLQAYEIEQLADQYLDDVIKSKLTIELITSVIEDRLNQELRDYLNKV